MRSVSSVIGSVLFIVCFFTFVAGCSKTSRIQMLENSEVQEQEDVTMTVTDYSNQCFTVVLTNHSDLDYMYGNDFAFDLYGDDWTESEFTKNRAWTAEGLFLPAHESVELELDLRALGQLEKGRYRIRKTVSTDYLVDGKYLFYTVIAEFDLN